MSSPDCLLAPLLRLGCHVLGFVPVTAAAGGRRLVPFVGSLRVVEDADGLAFSGDLYATGPAEPLDPVSGAEVVVEIPDARAGIPVLPHRAYDSYLRGLAVRQGPGSSAAVVFERYAFNHQSEAWLYAGSFVADLERVEPTVPAVPGDDWVGIVRDAAGAAVAVMTLTWASPAVRSMKLLTAQEDGLEIPTDNGAGVDWSAVMRAVNWQIVVDTASAVVLPPPSGLWSEQTLHEAMAGSRGLLDLDTEWAYQMLCVGDFDPAEIDSQTLGVMYDRASDDLNGLPREGFAVAANRGIGTDASYGSVAGHRVGAEGGVYFRVAAHELGHALGLHHESDTPYFMTTTSGLAGLGTEATPFPNNIIYEFSPESRRRLQHLPDPEVRPGGPFRPERPARQYDDLPPLPRPTRQR